LATTGLEERVFELTARQIKHPGWIRVWLYTSRNVYLGIELAYGDYYVYYQPGFCHGMAGLCLRLQGMRRRNPSSGCNHICIGRPKQALFEFSCKLPDWLLVDSAHCNEGSGP
jgi:hypothetical protein